MTRPSFAAHWRSIHDQQDFAHLERGVLRWHAEPNDWVQNPSGESITAFNTYMSLRLWAGGKASDFANYCLAVAKRDADEALRRDGFAAAKPVGSFPANRHDFLLNKVFIDAFVGDGTLNKETVILIAQDQKALAPCHGPRQWDGYPQSMYLHDVDLLLLVDEYERARSMLKEARSLNGLHVKEVAAVTKVIAKTSGQVQDNVEIRDQYRRMFDLLRDPAYPDGLKGHPAFPLQMLVMACMWQKFFEPRNGHFSLDRAIDLKWE